MRILPADLEGLAAARKIVAGGGVICYPTDTVYGLGCDPLNSAAVEKALTAKGRGTRAMPVLVRAVEDAERLVFVSKSARTLAKEFWPGPLSIVLQARDVVSAILAPERTLAVRSPDHAICQQLLALCSGMLVGTSANKTGRPAAMSAEEVVEQLDDSVDLVLDGGRSKIGVASTVVDLTKERVLILREGPIEKARIIKALRKSR